MPRCLMLIGNWVLWSTEIGVNCVNGGIGPIYTGGYDKGEWYSGAFSAYGGVHNMFSMEKRDVHPARRRMLRSVLQISPALQAILEAVLYRRILPLITTVPDGVLEAYELFSAVTLRICLVSRKVQTSPTTQMLPGSGCTTTRAASRTFSGCKRCQTSTVSFQSSVSRSISGTGLVGQKSVYIEEWCDAAEKAIMSGRDATLLHDYPSVYGQPRSMLKSKEEDGVADAEEQSSQVIKEQRLIIASDMLDHLAAGFDTSGITLTYLAWEPSRSHNAAIQWALQEELRSLNSPTRMADQAETTMSLPESKDVNELSLLQALRMRY